MDIQQRQSATADDQPGRDASPSFSPDGRWIVFESDRGGNYQLYAIALPRVVKATRLTDSSAIILCRLSRLTANG